MKLWFDEDLSPTLVLAATDLGVEATCNRDRGMLGCNDRALRERVQNEGFVLVTDNASDFRPMYAREAIHPGLIVMPGQAGRERQRELVRTVICHIIAAASSANEPPADFMINKLVEIDVDGSCTVRPLPAG